MAQPIPIPPVHRVNVNPTVFALFSTKHESKPNNAIPMTTHLSLP